jgi:hypothetical protein
MAGVSGLNPQSGLRSILNGNAIGRRHEGRAVRCRYIAYKIDDGASGGAVVLRIELR